MRLPRFFGKKRGHRRTGSQAWGSIGEAVFYAALGGAGLGFAGLLLTGSLGVGADEKALPWARWWLWLFSMLIPGALLAFGIAGLVRIVRGWGKSEERQAAVEGLANLLGSMAPPEDGDRRPPGVPACDDLVNSPGTILRYRLPIESPESWTLVGMGLFAGLWNAVLVVLAAGAGIDLMSGRVEWVLLAVLVPFAAVGIGGIALFVRRLVLTTAVGTTQLEICDHPLLPGTSYDVLLAQGGSGIFRSLALALEIEEMASFRQGTDTRTERIIVWRETVKEWTNLEITPAVRFETHVTVTIPAGAMHSFASEHNAIRWRIVVRGQPERWPVFVRVFPVIVYPPSPARSTSDVGGALVDGVRG